MASQGVKHGMIYIQMEVLVHSLLKDSGQRYRKPLSLCTNGSECFGVGGTLE